MKKETVATGGVFAASLLVASCCLAPALFILFGVSVSALGALSVFEPYRPIFIALGAVALLYAGVRIFRTVPAEAGEACADGACAPDGSTRRLTRALFGVAAAVFAVAIAYPHVIALFL